MKNLLLSAILATGTLFCITEPALAACDTTVGTACDTQRVQANRPDHLGAKAATTVDMTCLSVISNEPTELVLASGRVAEGAEVTGRVVTSWRTQANSWKKLPSGYFLREICIPSKLLQNVMTLCNESNRSVWSASDTALLRKKKRIPASDPACMLGKEQCAAFGL